MRIIIIWIFNNWNTDRMKTNIIFFGKLFIVGKLILSFEDKLFIVGKLILFVEIF